MIQLKSLSYTIGPRTLFDGLDWVLAPGDRWALVGPNGAGKTTLIKVILGQLDPASGERVMARGTRLGYLPQEAAERFDGTVLDRAMEAYRELLDARIELDAIQDRLAHDATGHADPADATGPAAGAAARHAADLDKAGELQTFLERHDEHTLEPRARRILGGLGFSPTDQDRPLAEFSGGWRMRAALAALLLAEPTFLFLDEPTNHLDLPAMEWLEDYLDDFDGGLVIISHDRVFLDRVADGVMELEHASLTPYPMGFSQYLVAREETRERMAAENEQLDKKIAQLSRFVERFGAKNTKATQAQSKRKMIERLASERKIIPRRSKSISFSFPPPPHAGKLLLALSDVRFAYPGGPDIIANATLEIARGDKVAIVGANGAGKTTLLRLLAGQLAPAAGDVRVFELTRSGYFAQHAAETLDPAVTALGALEEKATDAWRPKLRSLLGNFLLTGDDAFKPCRVLSGGERQRVALARLLLESTNLVLLDEPTHHLDLAGKDVLEEALSQYPGGVVVVTHDRSLMARVATRVIEVNDGRAIVYPGGYDDYESARVARNARGTGAPAPVPGPGPTPSRGSTPLARANSSPVATAPQAATAQPQPSKNTQKKRAEAMQAVERRIEASEAALKRVEEGLADPATYAAGAETRAKELVGEQRRLRAELDALWKSLEEFA
ncbi:MAG TPA: ABC-F family ATP-binding cassette domain-containing protein [Candidatus Eisenbacteria bacterium]